MFSCVAMETKRYFPAVASNLLLNGSWKKDTKTSLSLFQPGEKSSQGLMHLSQVKTFIFWWPFACGYICCVLNLITFEVFGPVIDYLLT